MQGGAGSGPGLLPDVSFEWLWETEVGRQFSDFRLHVVRAPPTPLLGPTLAHADDDEHVSGSKLSPGPVHRIYTPPSSTGLHERASPGAAKAEARRRGSTSDDPQRQRQQPYERAHAGVAAGSDAGRGRSLASDATPAKGGPVGRPAHACMTPLSAE